MELKRIVKAEGELFERLVTLYQEAFPEKERRAVSQLGRLIECEPALFFNAIIEDDGLAGFFVYWKFEDFYYLEYLAVYPALRNRKIGQQVLDYIDMHLKGERLLEVEPAEDEMTTRRINYYRRNGYEVVEKKYMQPPYERHKEGLALWVMGNKVYSDPALLQGRIRQIQQQVYIKPMETED